MKKSNVLNYISIIACIEIFIFIIYPVYLFSTTDDLELGAGIVGFTFGTLIIYYIFYLIALSRFIQSKPLNPKTAMWVVLNVLPIVIYVLLYTVIS